MCCATWLKAESASTGLVTVVLLILWPALDAAAVRDAARSAEKADEITPAVLRVVRIGLAVGSLFLGSLLWEIDLIGEGAGIGAAIARGALEIGVVLLLAYAAWEALREGPVGILVTLALIAFTLSLSYHLLNGVRHLAWDAGKGFDPKGSNQRSILIFAGAIVITALIWIFAGGLV